MSRNNLVGLVLGLVIGCQPVSHSKEDWSPDIILEDLSREMEASLMNLEIDSTSIPRSLSNEGTLKGVTSHDWTSGFFPGELWMLYAHNKRESIKSAAVAWTSFVEKEKKDDHTHDTGFKVYCSFGKGYEVTRSPEYRSVILETAKTLISRFSPKIGCIRSWDFNQEEWQFPVIVDNMMNLEMLFAATRLGGDSIYYRVAASHAKTTMANHFRSDFSSYHVVDYDTITGVPRLKQTHQGFSDESAWARGQGWGLYGYIMCYRETGNMAFLNHAQAIAHFILNHPRWPNDEIPYWDFDSDELPHAPRDASAAAVMASALLELSQYVEKGSDRYYEVAIDILKELSSKRYRRMETNTPFILDHSVGSFPHDMEVDVPIVYADYYFIEALLRAKQMRKKL